MSTLKNRYQFLLPLLAGVFCSMLGPVLVTNDEPLVQLVGGCLLLWVPGCIYYTMRGCRTRLPRPVTMKHKPVLEQLDSEAMAVLVSGGMR